MSAVAAGQMDIFEAIRQREVSLERVTEAADRSYRRDLEEAIVQLADGGQPFCSDDIRALAGDPPAGCSPNIAGAAIMAALKQSQVQQVGFTRSARVIGHGNRVGLYVGKGFGA